MKLALIQARPVRGDLAANLADHLATIDAAARQGCELIAFPELSLTGYEPARAAELALAPDSPRLDALQAAADRHAATVVAGAPIAGRDKPQIGAVIFGPHRPRRLYAKQFLHADEEPHFAPGPLAVAMVGDRIALAICYELSVPAHAEAAFAAGARGYLAVVAKTARGVAQAQHRLAELAGRHAVPVAMANCVGPSGDGDCAGGSAAWTARGELCGRLEGDPGMLVVDTVS